MQKGFIPHLVAIPTMIPILNSNAASSYRPQNLPKPSCIRKTRKREGALRVSIIVTTSKSRTNQIPDIQAVTRTYFRHERCEFRDCGPKRDSNLHSNFETKKIPIPSSTSGSSLLPCRYEGAVQRHMLYRQQDIRHLDKSPRSVRPYLPCSGHQSTRTRTVITNTDEYQQV